MPRSVERRTRGRRWAKSLLDLADDLAGGRPVLPDSMLPHVELHPGKGGRDGIELDGELAVNGRRVNRDLTAFERLVGGSDLQSLERFVHGFVHVLHRAAEGPVGG